MEDWSQKKSKLYKSYRWKKVRAAQLKRQSFCERCLSGIGQTDCRSLRVAKVADHKIPCTDEKSFWSNELQSLCLKCHMVKSRTEDRLWHKRRRLLTPIDFSDVKKQKNP